MKLYQYKWYWYLNMIVSSISSIVLIVLSCIHIYHVFRASSTSISKNRKAHLISILTVLSLLFFSGILIINALAPWSFILNHCWIVVATGTVIYSFGKLFMWLVFLLRLHAVYETTAYEYSKGKLIFVGICLIMITCLASIWHFFRFKVDPYIYTNIHIGSLTAIKCNAIFFKVTTAMLLLVDFSSSIAFIVAFVKPLFHLAKSMNITNNIGHNTAHSLDLFKVGSKAMILTGIPCISSLIMLIVIIPIQPVGILLLGFDAIINSIGLMLMTTYYEEKYFKILCGCFVRLILYKTIGNHVHTDISMVNSVSSQSPTQKSIVPTCNEINSETSINI